MADLETRLIAKDRLMQRKDAKHKKELDRLHRELKRVKAQLERERKGGWHPCPTCTSMLDGRGT